ncbi:MAG: PAS domain-containing protein [Solirubrobacterales bacterium]
MNKKQLPTAAPETLLSALAEIASMAIAFIDKSYCFVYVNDAAARQVGMSKEYLEGLPASAAVPVFWPELKTILDRVLDGETILNLDVDLTESSEERREWLGSFYPFRQDGEVIAVACTSVDVTELRDIERELQVRNDLFAMLARTHAAVIHSATKEELFKEICEIACTTGNFRFAWVGEPVDGVMTVVASAGNEAGYIEALESEELTITVDPDDPRSHGPTGQAYLHGEISVVNDFLESSATELWSRAADEVGFRGSAAIPIRQHGRVVAVLSLYAEREGFFTEDLVETLAEVTPSLSLAMERFELERRRDENEAALKLRDRALTAATQGVVITDARSGDNPVIYVTPAFEDLTGYTSEEMVGRNCRILQGEATDPVAVRKIHDAVEAGAACEVELVNYRKDGSSFWNLLTIYPIFDDGRGLTNFVSVQTDVTERRILQNQRRQAQKMEAVGQLAGGVAHDFNNVLTAIRASADLAYSEVESESVKNDLKQIDKAAEHAAHLTRQLLAFSRQQVLQPLPTDLNQVLAETIDLVTRLIGDNIEIERDLSPDIEAALVDQAQLQQVIINLAINARDAMPDGGTITVRTTSCELDESYVTNRLVPAAGQFVLIEIADSGVGMDEASRSKVFEPFYTTKSEGTGLGLATVYGIVRQSGGHIAVESEPNASTKFSIYLPTTERAIEPARPGAKVGSLDGTETILHVEDSEMLRPLIIRALGRRGYKVLSAASAEEAIEMAKNETGGIDLMLTDIVMPGLNGRELAEILVKKYPEMRVLFTSGYPADMVIREGIAEGGINFIEKPFIAKDLLPLIRSILDDSSRVDETHKARAPAARQG